MATTSQRAIPAGHSRRISVDEACPSVDEVGDPERTKDSVPDHSASHTRSNEDASDDNVAEADDPDRTGSVGLVDDEPEPSGRKKAAAGRPTVAGYDILQRLGEGGMGVVYKARHLGLNRLVALKMIRGGSQARADHFSRFRIEAEAVARLRHPNILQIYDIGEADGLPFVALELLDGGSLDERLAGTPQPGRPAAELMVTLARAVHVAHECGIVHRDLKPSNVLYTSDGVPKITDFGLAKRIDSDDGQTQSGQIMGSPSYMAPEQARGDSRDVGPAADVYSLGAILYEMLTGRPPFKGETPMETVRQVIDDDPVTPSRLVPRVAADLETICLKCLHKEPARRYESAQALADDLTRYLARRADQGPTDTRPGSAGPSGPGDIRRKRSDGPRPSCCSSSAFVGAFAWERNARIQAQSLARSNERNQDPGSQLIDQAREAANRRGAGRLPRLALSNFRVEIRDAPGLDVLRIAGRRGVEEAWGSGSARSMRVRRRVPIRERIASGSSSSRPG